MKRLLALSMALALCCPVFADDKGQPAPAAPVKKDAPKKDAAPKKDDKAAPPAGMPDPKAMEAAMEAAAKPGAYHEWMKQLEGDWTAVVREMGMDGKWSESKGECTNKLVFGGRFMETSFKGRSQGKFFYGGGVMGYNNMDKRFESIWYDSMSTGMMTMYGTADKDGKVVTLKGEFTSPMDGKKMSMREMLTIVSKDKHTLELFMPMPGPDGKEMETKMMEITYTKGKAEAQSEKADKPEKKEEKKK